LFDFDLGKKNILMGKKKKNQFMVQAQFPEFFLGDKEVVRGEE